MAYMGEFMRTLAPGGMAVFQIPERRVQVEPALDPPAPEPPAPLDPAAFKAHIAPCTKAYRVAPGATFPVRAMVTNQSPLPWPRFENSDMQHWIRLANRWLDEEKTVIRPHDARGDLARTLGPGEQLEITLTATAPSMPGDYLLELDMLQEVVGWFAQNGSPVARIPVRVALDADASIASSADHQTPRMEMHGVERATVEALMGDHGGQVLDVTEGHCPGWVSWRYWVLRR